MTTSAGLVVFRVRAGRLQMLLGHMGGPFWARKDDGAWSIPKGELSEDEDPFAASLREYTEELGHAPPDGPVIELGETRQRPGKRLVAFAVEGDFDPAQLAAGTFELEWPPRSGRLETFPEIDRVAWFDLASARRKIVQGQAVLLERLAERISAGEAAATTGSRPDLPADPPPAPRLCSASSRGGSRRGR